MSIKVRSYNSLLNLFRLLYLDFNCKKMWEVFEAYRKTEFRRSIFIIQTILEVPEQ
ncbi:MAG: hypothetical protein KAX49_17560 [Halanaerobiales bacterium]|nr:hypothetical protein [Halanaerobiales bacterium]